MVDNLTNSLYEINAIRQLETLAIEKYAVSEATLMERAGQAAYAQLRQAWPNAASILVLCGPGNNGGDGYVVARLAHQQGLAVSVVAVGDLDSLPATAKAAAQACVSAGMTILSETQIPSYQVDVIVDALLGIGLRRDVSPKWAALIEQINQLAVPVLAIDVPSGLHADTGHIYGIAIKADVTMTFIGMKQGFVTGAGVDHCGKIVCDDLDLPPQLFQKVSVNAISCSLESCRGLSRRQRHGHKGHYGHVLIVGGNHGMVGAVMLAGKAALRVGAGLVTVATRSSHAIAVPSYCPELMCHAVENTAALIPLIARATMLIIGPGLGQDRWAKQLFDHLTRVDIPKVVDADGLNLLAKAPMKRQDWILTPHVGEAARLLACDTKAIQTDSFTKIRQLQQQYGGQTLLKGAGTLIVGEDQQIAVCRDGNPGMASGGMGDVLSGVIGGLVAQKLTLSQATQLGVCLHARAGDIAAEFGENSVIGSDVIAQLRGLL